MITELVQRSGIVVIIQQCFLLVCPSCIVLTQCYRHRGSIPIKAAEALPSNERRGSEAKSALRADPRL